MTTSREDREDFERLVKVETRLEVVEDKIDELKSDNEKRLDELKSLVVENSLMGLIKANKLVAYPIIVAAALNQLGWNPAEILQLLVPVVKASWP